MTKDADGEFSHSIRGRRHSMPLVCVYILYMPLLTLFQPEIFSTGYARAFQQRKTNSSRSVNSGLTPTSICARLSPYTSHVLVSGFEDVDGDILNDKRCWVLYCFVLHLSQHIAQNMIIWRERIIMCMHCSLHNYMLLHLLYIYTSLNICVELD